MSLHKIGESAFPVIETEAETYQGRPYGDTYSTGGLSKREYFAIRVLQAMLANPVTVAAVAEMTPAEAGKEFSERAVEIVDALVEQLKKQPTKE